MCRSPARHISQRSLSSRLRFTILSLRTSKAATAHANQFCTNHERKRCRHPITLSSSSAAFEAAHALRAKHKETFWTAQEYLIECFDMMDRGVCKAGEVVNFDRALTVEKARRLGTAFATSFEKKGAGPGQGAHANQFCTNHER